VGIYTVSPAFIEEGEKKLQEAISIYKEFFMGVEEPELDNYTIIGQL